MDSFWTPPEPEEAPEPIYVAVRTLKYRFSDGTIIRLTEGVSPLNLTEAQLEELLRFDRIREVN